MKKYTFDHVYTTGRIIHENELFQHYHDPELKIRYDSNFIQFKRLPSLDEFINTEAWLRQFHLNLDQHFVKFYFPDDEKPSEEILDYLNKQGYEQGVLELYAIEPKDFPEVQQQEKVKIKTVDQSNLETFQIMHFKQSVLFSKEFAEAETEMIETQFKQQHIEQVLAYYDDLPVGYVTIIIGDDWVEIDDLLVEVTHQRKGIGGSLQWYVMDNYSDKTVILVADQDDTAREMYQRQHYQCIGIQYEVQKVYAN